MNIDIYLFFFKVYEPLRYVDAVKKYIYLYFRYLISKNTFYFFIDTAQDSNALFQCNSIGLPPIKKKLTIVRSPHIHKKAKEKFIYNLNKHLITINIYFRVHMLMCLYFFK
jgi:hypothetical protein